MSRRYTNQEKQVILNFYRQGIKIAMLSKNFGIPDSTISTWVSIDRGFVTKKEDKPVSAENIGNKPKTNTVFIQSRNNNVDIDAEKEEILEAKRHIEGKIKEKSEISKAKDFVSEKIGILDTELDDDDSLFSGYKEGYRDGLNEVFKYLKILKKKNNYINISRVGKN